MVWYGVGCQQVVQVEVEIRDQETSTWQLPLETRLDLWMNDGIRRVESAAAGQCRS